MTKVVGVRWRTADPVTYAKAGDFSLPLKSYVVVQLEKSQELAWVCRKPAELVAAQPEEGLSVRVVRRATAGDLGRLQQNRDMEQDTFKIARTKARELEIPMKIVDAHYTFDRARMVGDRDVAKLTGGIGRCGMTLCCVRRIEKFESISVRMAKEQALPISADGLAGACGRLRCCLRFEYEQYRQINRALPKIGELVGTPNGSATVIVGHRLKETVSVRYGDDRVMELPLADVTRNQPSRN